MGVTGKSPHTVEASKEFSSDGSHLMCGAAMTKTFNSSYVNVVFVGNSNQPPPATPRFHTACLVLIHLSFSSTEISGFPPSRASSITRNPASFRPVTFLLSISLNLFVKSTSNYRISINQKPFCLPIACIPVLCLTGSRVKCLSCYQNPLLKAKRFKLKV